MYCAGLAVSADLITKGMIPRKAKNMKTIFAVPTGGVQGTGSDNNNDKNRKEA